MTYGSSPRLTLVANVLKWIAYLFIAIMLYLIFVPSTINAINPFPFAVFAGSAYVDGFIIDGVQALLYKGQPWKSHFLPAMAILNLGAILIFLGGFYNPWPIEVSGLFVVLIGFFMSVNQVDRALWHPR